MKPRLIFDFNPLFERFKQFEQQMADDYPDGQTADLLALWDGIRVEAGFRGLGTHTAEDGSLEYVVQMLPGSMKFVGQKAPIPVEMVGEVSKLVH